ncbi:ECF transporter S component [Anaerocolumna aminovalerica]|jgi:energy-coupling factor transport system substrate-specific component|uniref:Energy-coupling factor transport system substrate-specific component n=1 Tax=Anaerocolumna aminovalerica TaxID=1527 RepID=A0A1I5FI41_9FIRM|nr:ECF transporter S component [Anaerocolumna aminovalerica]MBU5334095.1 ECF transporter S component [Anaerocolumna aminovalerica]MDU6264716.1 ECF transporter S component [Anaerocolumna aminovalerica]SFO23415.1 energy-coupling factor transport system substrate-specific component [Anaerocolumna aminovalerica]
MSKKLWSLKFNTATLVLIPAAIGINYLGKLFASLLKLPLWLDAIGTCLAAVLGGPIIGAVCGAVNNIIYGLTLDPISTVYALTNIGIGIVVGILAYKGFMKNLKGAILTGIIVGIVAVIISTPLNIYYWGGTTGNVWGDALYAWAVSQNMPMWLASGLDELVVDVPDKLAVVILVFIIQKSLPKNLLNLFHNNEEVESLD